MKESRDMVLRELETEQIRRTNLTKEELQKAYFMNLFVKIGKKIETCISRAVLASTEGKE